MTRRPRRPQLGGIIVIQCQYEHVLGTVASGPGGDIQPLDGNGWKGSILDVLAQPLAMECDRCRAEGRRPDLRGSWGKVRALSDLLEANMERREEIYRLGG